MVHTSGNRHSSPNASGKSSTNENVLLAPMVIFEALTAWLMIVGPVVGGGVVIVVEVLVIFSGGGIVVGEGGGATRALLMFL